MAWEFDYLIRRGFDIQNNTDCEYTSMQTTPPKKPPNTTPRTVKCLHPKNNSGEGYLVYMGMDCEFE